MKQILFLTILLCMSSITASNLCSDITQVNELPCIINTPELNCSTNAFIYKIGTPSINYSASMNPLNSTCVLNCYYQFLFTYISEGNYNISLCDNRTYAVISIQADKVIVTSNLSVVEIFNPISYPYVDVNASYPMDFKVLVNGISTNIGLVNITINGTDFSMPWSSTYNHYSLTVNFTQTGNFNFVIHSNNSLYPNFTGTFLVRSPFYITFCGFNKDGSKYVNDNAYMIAEFSSGKTYNVVLEQYLTPFTMNIIGTGQTFKTPVFHSVYSNGCSQLKLYEANESYVIRLLDGQITFQTTFSTPNVTKSYGLNSYVGKYTFDGIDTSYRLIFSQSDLNQYGWLFNWIAVGIIVLSIIASIFIFFTIPQYPMTSVVFFIIMLGGTLITRIVVWFFLG